MVMIMKISKFATQNFRGHAKEFLPNLLAILALALKMDCQTLQKSTAGHATLMLLFYCLPSAN
jgi:hypothetical protein